MVKYNYEISITINGTNGSFVFGAEKKNKIMTDNKEEAVRVFNQQWNILAKYSAPKLYGGAALTLNEVTPCNIVGSWTNLKTVQFGLTQSLLRELVQNGYVTID